MTPAADDSDLFPHFDREVAPGGYQWWYIDGGSPDGEHQLVIIAFVGSVFSPYYASARQRGTAAATDFCALNVALYSRGRQRWVLTERPAHKIARSRRDFVLDRSRLHWDGNALHIEIDEYAVPVPRRVRGTVTVTPHFLTAHELALDSGAAHHWWPLAPSADVEVAFDAPDLRWRGAGYFDTNRGRIPLEDAFEQWNWSRAHSASEANLTYNVTEHGKDETSIALRVTADGQVHEREIAPRHVLPTSGWRMHREIRTSGLPHVVRTLEDTPFYVRSVVGLQDSTVPIMHESLSMTRFCQPWVQRLLPFRTRRDRS